MVPPLSGGPEEKDVRVGRTPMCDWSGSGVDSEVVGGVWWPSWTDRRTDGGKQRKALGCKVTK